MLLTLPLINFSNSRSSHFRPLTRILFYYFFIVTVILTFIGGQPVEQPYLIIGQIASGCYFSYFILLPIFSIIENRIYQYNIILNQPTYIDIIMSKIGNYLMSYKFINKLVNKLTPKIILLNKLLNNKITLLNNILHNKIHNLEVILINKFNLLKSYIINKINQFNKKV